MRLTQSPDCHLSYCTNIHPGESWPEVDKTLRNCLPAVKTIVSPNQAMGVGLRLSALAARQLMHDDELLHVFKAWLQQQDLYVYTVNGFPYGAFHGETIKEKVYQPDWAEPERLIYSRHLAIVLSRLLPEHQHGSISTVPLGYKPDFNDPARIHMAVDKLLQLVVFLAEHEHESGTLIQYALEPEPGCCLETTRDTVAFFQQHIFTGQAVEQLKQYLPRELVSKADIALIKRHLGVCLDSCHAAVMFEQPLMMLKTLTEAGIPVHKIQLTAALNVLCLTPALREQLAQFADPVYLHQTSVRGAGDTKQLQHYYSDLTPALTEAVDGVELRSHFHVPVFAEHMGGLMTTQADLIELLAELRRDSYCSHLEVETYTFDLLPEELKQGSIVANVCREINWVREQLAI
jgi:hypothetical protein